MNMNFKILITIRMTGGFDGGKATAVQLIEYEDKQLAETAYKQLCDARIQDAVVVKLWK